MGSFAAQPAPAAAVHPVEHPAGEPTLQGLYSAIQTHGQTPGVGQFVPHALETGFATEADKKQRSIGRPPRGVPVRLPPPRGQAGGRSTI